MLTIEIHCCIILRVWDRKTMRIFFAKKLHFPCQHLKVNLRFERKNSSSQYLWASYWRHLSTYVFFKLILLTLTFSLRLFLNTKKSFQLTTFKWRLDSVQLLLKKRLFLLLLALLFFGSLAEAQITWHHLKFSHTLELTTKMSQKKKETINIHLHKLAW